MRLLLLALLIAAAALAAPGAAARAGPDLSVPEGYTSFEAGPCQIAVPRRNAKLAEDLGAFCRSAAPPIFRQLGAPDAVDRASIRVRVVARPQDIESVSPPGMHPPDWSGAVAFPRYGLVVLSLRHRSGGPVGNLEAVLEHELSHLALRRSLPPGTEVPRWLSEGIAVLQSEGSSLGRKSILWRAALGDELMPLEAIERYPGRAGRVPLAYAQSADFVGFLLRDEGWPGIRALLQSIAKEAELEQAFLEVYGRPLAEAESDWRSELSDDWRWVALVTGSGALWGAMTLLFVAAYLAVRRRRKRRLEEMAAEEEPVERLIGVMEELRRQAELEGGSARMPDRFEGDQKSRRRVKTKVVVDGEIHTLH
ncbi:MAG: peptidase MA family metallohydrolase [Polyangia bacterium]